MFNTVVNIPKSEITNEVIAGWKRRHSEVFEIAVDDKKGYFRGLNMVDFKSGKAGQAYGKDALDTALKTLKLTWLGGDKEFLRDTEYILAAIGELQPFFEKSLRRFYPSIKR